MERVSLDPWKDAYDMHQKVGLSFEDSLSYYQEYGYIFSTPFSLIWAEPFMNESWLVYLAIGKGCIPMFINAMPFWLPNFAFARLLRQRHNLKKYNLERLCNLYGIDSENLKARKIPT